MSNLASSDHQGRRLAGCGIFQASTDQIQLFQGCDLILLGMVAEDMNRHGSFHALEINRNIRRNGEMELSTQGRVIAQYVERVST